MVVTTSFICQQINMGLDDLICRLSTQLAGIVKPMVESEVQNMHAQELRNVHLEDKSTTSCHFGWGATEGSLATSSVAPFSTGGQPGVDHQKTTHSAFQLNWCILLQANAQNAP